MYVQLYIYPVARKHSAAFLRIQKEAAQLYKDYGAIDDEMFEAANLDPKYGCVSFPTVISFNQDETLFFSVTRFHSRGDQEEVMAKVNVDPRIGKLYSQVTDLVESRSSPEPFITEKERLNQKSH